MIRELHTKQSLLMVLYLCQAHYQVLLIIFLEGFVIDTVRIHG